MQAPVALSLAETILLALRVLIVIALYGFLGLTLWALLRERQSPQAPVPPARLIQQPAGSAPASEHVLRASTWIGRDPNCAVRVSDEYASARHACLTWDAVSGAWWIEDNASRNGTWVNDERVMRCALSSGDIIRVGEARFRFEV